MGSSSSVPDRRKSVQKKMEKDMRMQLIVPYDRLCIRNDIHLFAMGTFEGGEFKQIADLTVNSFLDKKMEVHSEPPLTDTYYRSIAHNNMTCVVHIIESLNTHETYIADLNNALLGKVIDKTLYGLESELYVVRKVYASTKFLISVGKDMACHESDKECVWGYNLQRYKLDSVGKIYLTRETGKIY